MFLIISYEIEWIFRTAIYMASNGQEYEAIQTEV